MTCSRCAAGTGPGLGARDEFKLVVDRRDRLAVPEGTLADGSNRTPNDLAAVRQTAARLFAKAYANTGNEIGTLAEVRAFERFRPPHAMPICSQRCRDIGTGWKRR